ncbi:MAG: hypothetical protein AB7H80_04050 [Candidatus Kapaibacterium sp.]
MLYFLLTTITRGSVMQVADFVSEMDRMVSRGEIVDAVDRFFAEDATTLDFDGTATSTKGEMLEKMNGFVGAIEQVKGITHHHSVVGNDVSMSEFTFDFLMKDGAEILWHEVIRREWREGKVVNEQHFKN